MKCITEVLSAVRCGHMCQQTAGCIAFTYSKVHEEANCRLLDESMAEKESQKIVARHDCKWRLYTIKTHKIMSRRTVATSRECFSTTLLII